MTVTETPDDAPAGQVPTRAPRPKVAAAGIGGAVATIVVWALELAGVDVPAEVAAAVASLVAFAAGYLKVD